MEARPVRLSPREHTSPGKLARGQGKTRLVWSLYSGGMGRHSPVALVPNPAVASCLGTEVSPAQVVDLRGEAQQAPVSVGPVHVVSRLGEAVLLVGTVELAEWAVLQVGRLLHELGVHHEVWSTCAAEGTTGVQGRGQPCWCSGLRDRLAPRLSSFGEPQESRVG